MNIIEELINYIKYEHSENSENILKNIGIQDLIHSNLSEEQEKESKEDKFKEIIEIGLQKEL